MPIDSYQNPHFEATPGMGVHLFNCGYSNNDSGRPSREARWTRYTSLHLVLRGAGFVRTPHGSFNARSGDLFCFLADEFIDYGDHPEDPWAYFWASLSGADAPAVARACGFTTSDHSLRARDARPVASAWRSLIGTLAHARNPSQYLLHARLLELIHHIREACPPASETDPPKTGLVERAELLFGASTHRLNVTELAETLGVHRSTLYHTFARTLGVRPVEWLRRQRIEHAKRLLAETDLKIDAVATASGHADPKYFMRTFRRYEGMTPGAYRRQMTSSE